MILSPICARCQRRNNLRRQILGQRGTSRTFTDRLPPAVPARRDHKAQRYPIRHQLDRSGNEDHGGPPQGGVQASTSGDLQRIKRPGMNHIRFSHLPRRHALRDYRAWRRLSPDGSMRLKRIDRSGRIVGRRPNLRPWSRPLLRFCRLIRLLFRPIVRNAPDCSAGIVRDE